MNKNFVKGLDKTMAHLQKVDKEFDVFKLSEIAILDRWDDVKIDDLLDVLVECGYLINSRDVSTKDGRFRFVKLTTKGRIYTSWKREQQNQTHRLARQANVIAWISLGLVLLIETIQLYLSLYN